MWGEWLALRVLSVGRRAARRPDIETRARAAAIAALLEHVCGPDERPRGVTDDVATLYDVCTVDAYFIAERIWHACGVYVGPEELRLPLWQLVDLLTASDPGRAGSSPVTPPSNRPAPPRTPAHRGRGGA